MATDKEVEEFFAMFKEDPQEIEKLPSFKNLVTMVDLIIKRLDILEKRLQKEDYYD